MGDLCVFNGTEWGVQLTMGDMMDISPTTTKKMYMYTYVYVYMYIYIYGDMFGGCLMGYD